MSNPPSDPSKIASVPPTPAQLLARANDKMRTLPSDVEDAQAAALQALALVAIAFLTIELRRSPAYGT